MRNLPAVATFTRADLRVLGWSDGSISRAVTSGRLERIRRGQLRRPGCVDPRVPVIAAARAIAGAVVSHRSGVLLHDLPMVGPQPRHPEMTVQPTGRGSAHNTLLHRATLAARDIVIIDDIAVTSAARTCIDVARRCGVTTAVSATDAALNRGLTSFDELDDVVLRCWNWPGIRRAHRVLRLVDGRSESPLESVSRLVIGWLGLPRPDLQARVLDEDGHVTGRLDLYWDEFGVAGEADGRSKYDERQVLTAEKERQERIEDLGVTVTRWRWTDTRQPLVLRRKIEHAFRRGAARDRSSLPRAWSILPTKPITSEENLIDWSPARRT